MAALTRFSPRHGLALGWLLLVSAAGLAAPYLPLPFAPAAPDLAHMSVSPAAGAPFGHWLGTDALGRDVLANLLFGSRTVLLLTLPAALLGGLLGGLLGSVAGFWSRGLDVPRPAWLLVAGLLWWGLALPPPALGLLGSGLAAGWVVGARRAGRPLPTWPVPLDGLVLGAGAVLGTVPRLLLVLAVAAGGQLSTSGLLVLLALTSWPGPARLVRAEVLRVRGRPFVEAAQVLGLPPVRIWARHVLPLALGPLLVDLPLSLAGLIGLESTLSFLGVGLAPDQASWGRLLSAARLDVGAWWTAAFPIALLALTIVALQTLARRPARP